MEDELTRRRNTSPWSSATIAAKMDASTSPMEQNDSADGEEDNNDK